MPTSKKIRGFATQSAGEELKPFEYERPELGTWDVEIEITHCGICHSDLHLVQDDWHISKYPLLPGHEIVGVVKEKGSEVKHLEIGERVGVGWQCNSCHSCEWCLEGEENLCPKGQPTCLGRFGGFAEAIITDSRLVFSLPDSLASENVAPLLCGGATVFSPFIQHKVNATTRVGVIGIGGLGHLALQFANAFGCEVYAFSGSPDKKEEAEAFGATHFLSSQDPRMIKKAANSIDLLLCTSSAPMLWEAFFETLRPKGKLCLLGVPADGVISLPIVSLIEGRKTICGSNIASGPVIRKMLSLAARHEIVAQTELFPMQEVNQAMKKLASNRVHYRAVLKN